MRRGISAPPLCPALRLLALAGFLAGVRLRRDAWPFCASILFFASLLGALAVLFWPYMIPCSVTVADAAPDTSLSFLFWGAGVVVMPVICVYTAVVYWVFRGKLHKEWTSLEIPPPSLEASLAT